MFAVSYEVAQSSRVDWIQLRPTTIRATDYQGRPMAGAFIAFSSAIPNASGRMIGVNVGSVPAPHVRTYMSSATSDSVAKSTIKKPCRRVGFP